MHTQGGRPQDALAALDGHRAAWHGWEAGAAWLLTAWSEIALGRLDRSQAACVEATRLLTADGRPWALSHAEAILGGLAQAQHRFADATAHLRRAADAAHELGFAAAEALHLANLGRAEQQAGEPGTAVTTLRTAIETAHTAGDRRTVALAGVRLGRVLRALGRDEAARAEVDAAREWFRAAGGGDGALLAEHLSVALNPEPTALAEVLAAARAGRDAEVELLTLDRLALLHAERGDPAQAETPHAERGDRAQAQALLAAADGLLPAVAHLVTEDDRIDAAAARLLLIRRTTTNRSSPPR